jgi:hypothetical protein
MPAPPHRPSRAAVAVPDFEIVESLTFPLRHLSLGHRSSPTVFPLASTVILAQALPPAAEYVSGSYGCKILSLAPGTNRLQGEVFKPSQSCDWVGTFLQPSGDGCRNPRQRGVDCLRQFGQHTRVLSSEGLVHLDSKLELGVCDGLAIAIQRSQLFGSHLPKPVEWHNSRECVNTEKSILGLFGAAGM